MCNFKMTHKDTYPYNNRLKKDNNKYKNRSITHYISDRNTCENAQCTHMNDSLVTHITKSGFGQQHNNLVT